MDGRDDHVVEHRGEHDEAQVGGVPRHVEPVRGGEEEQVPGSRPVGEDLIGPLTVAGVELLTVTDERYPPALAETESLSIPLRPRSTLFAATTHVRSRRVSGTSPATWG